MNGDWRTTVERVRDPRLDDAERVEAARRLGTRPDSEIARALIDLAEDESLPDQVARQVGTSLALVAWHTVGVDSVPLADVTGEAYLGFDEQVAALQREARTKRPDDEGQTDEP